MFTSFACDQPGYDGRLLDAVGPIGFLVRDRSLVDQMQDVIDTGAEDESRR
jgi:hypothetical protein